MARNEEKFSHKRLNSQSTLEYALIFPILFLMILGIFELAFMWHQYYAVELAAREISANIVLADKLGCVPQDKALEIVKSKTAILQERNISFILTDQNGTMIFTSNEQYDGRPFVIVKIDCKASGNNGEGVQSSPSVQVQAVHKLHFFAASLPNFKTGKKIVIIPDNVVFTSTKVVTLGHI